MAPLGRADTGGDYSLGTGFLHGQIHEKAV
jgi:hypothetical protein